MTHSTKLKNILSACANVAEVVETCVGFRIACDNNDAVIAALVASGWRAKERSGFVVAWLAA